MVTMRQTGAFTVLVNYGDLRFGKLDKNNYNRVHEYIRSRHLPVHGKGQSEVTCHYLTYDGRSMSTAQEVLECIKGRPGIRLPDIAEVVYFLDAHHEEFEERLEHPVVGLCGSISVIVGQRWHAYVKAQESKRFLNLRRLGDRWDYSCRFLVVSTIKQTPHVKRQP